MEIITTLLELVAAVLIVTGLWIQWPWVALVAAGALILAFVRQLVTTAPVEGDQ